MAQKPLRAIVCEGKRAFRIWAAALEPASESFAVRLFQMHETKGPCLEAVRRTPAFDAVRVLLER